MIAMTDLPAVLCVGVIGDQRLRLLFADGTAATVVWPNGLDVARGPLYEQARRHPPVAGWPTGST
jgi:hypothetical protein